MALLYLTVSGGSGTGYHPSGTYVPIVASVPQGYAFLSWSSNNSPVTNPSSASTTVYLFGTTTVTANFSRVTYTVRYTANAGGSISSGASQTAYYGGTTSATCAPNGGYNFAGWTDGKSSLSRTDVCSGNATYTAQFEPGTPPPPPDVTHEGYIAFL